MKSKRSLFSLPSLLSLSLLFFFPHISHAINLTLTQTPGGPGKTYTLTWTAATKSTDTSKTTYYVFEEFGRDAVGYDTNNPTGHANFVVSKYEETSVPIGSFVGSRGFVVTSSDSYDGRIEVSNTVYHRFIHLSQDNDGAVIGRTDGDGTQRGVDQIWKFTYAMDDDAYVTMRIYAPGTTFVYDANGFAVGFVGTLVKTLMENTPRSGELDGNIMASNGDDTWDSRSSSGVIVGNGIYYVAILASLDAGQSGYSEGALRQGSVLTIPVDILRVINLMATGITLNSPTSTISYDLTGDALVRVVIAQPGSAFTLVGGDVYPSNRTTLAADSTLIVSSFTFQRKAGTNVEAWDGVSSTGTVMPSGVYPIGVSASDDYGNHAVDASGNDFPIFTTITLERSAGSDEGVTTISDTTPPTLTSISPADGAEVSATVSTITIVLADDTALNLNGTQVTIVGPNNTTVTGTRATSGQNTIYLTFSPPLSTNGTYTITIIAYDTAGNTVTFTRTFTINIRLETNNFTATTKVYPNPVQNANVTFSYDLSVDSTVQIEIFDLLGERVYSQTYNDAMANGVTHQWDLRNVDGQKIGSGLYLVRIRATGGGNKVETVKKLVIIQ
ncbi:MAG: T9SS type A sorting domain-containing protein [Elusimicrobia bacterium]|nr:T9SS type A sorting domain-containing protein [Candidatus Obscuribacterium magneticum]